MLCTEKWLWKCIINRNICFWHEFVAQRMLYIYFINDKISFLRKTRNTVIDFYPFRWVVSKSKKIKINIKILTKSITQPIDVESSCLRNCCRRYISVCVYFTDHSEKILFWTRLVYRFIIHRQLNLRNI